MSDNILRLIPADPASSDIGGTAQDDVLKILSTLVPAAQAMTIDRHDGVVFYDAGANFERVLCPFCATELSIEWWKARMDSASESSFEDLAVVTPCCSTPASLNDLAYEWPQAFAHWAIEVRGPDRPVLDDDELDLLNDAAGQPLRQVWAHY